MKVLIGSTVTVGIGIFLGIGGEILKYVCDGLLAIFLIDGRHDLPPVALSGPLSPTRSALSAPALRAHDKDPPLTSQYHVRSIPPGFRVRAGFDSGRGDCGDRNGMGRANAGEPAILFLPANTARRHVGISVGIGSNRR
jgi:hypothetical protein